MAPPWVLLRCSDSRVVVTETVWLTKPKIPTTWSFTETICQPRSKSMAHLPASITAGSGTRLWSVRQGMQLLWISVPDLYTLMYIISLNLHSSPWGGFYCYLETEEKEEQRGPVAHPRSYSLKMVESRLESLTLESWSWGLVGVGRRRELSGFLWIADPS